MTTTTGPEVDPLAALRAATVVAVLRAPSAEAGIRATAALIAGGVTGIEITYSTPDAAAVIREVRAQHGDGVYLGAGTVLDPAQAAEAVEAGARVPGQPGHRAEAGRRHARHRRHRAVRRADPQRGDGDPRLRRTRREAVSGLARRAGLPQGLAGAVPGRRLRAHRRRRRGQPRRLAGGGRGRRRSRRGPVPARGHGGAATGTPSPRPPGGSPPRRSGPGSSSG